MLIKILFLAFLILNVTSCASIFGYNWRTNEEIIDKHRLDLMNIVVDAFTRRQEDRRKIEVSCTIFFVKEFSSRNEAQQNKYLGICKVERFDYLEHGQGTEILTPVIVWLTGYDAETVPPKIYWTIWNETP